MLFRGVMATNLSGTLNGMVAAHNQGGEYLREHVIPTDPATPRQINCRDTMQVLWDEWNAMPEDQRQAWHQFARTQHHTNRIGVRIQNHGWTEWCRQKFAYIQGREQLALDWTTGTSPPIHVQRFVTLPYLTLETPWDEVKLYWDVEAWPAVDDHSGLFVYASLQYRPTINFFKGPYQLIGAVTGSEDPQPTPPVTFPLGFTVASGYKVWYKLLFVATDYIRAADILGQLQRP